MKNPISRLLNHLTKNPAEQKNVMRWGGCSILRHASIPLYANEVHQAWCYNLGLQTNQMAWLGLPTTIIHHIMMVFSCMLTDRITNRRRALVFLTACTCLGALGYFLMAIGPASFRTMPANGFLQRGAYLVLIWLGFNILGTIVSPFYGPVSAAVECRSIHNSIRGRQWSIFGMISGVVGLLLGAVGTLILRYVPYPFNFAICFGLSVLMILGATWFISGIAELPELAGEPVPAAKKTSFIDDLKKIFGLRVFWILMPANLLRGLGDGAGGYLTYVAFKHMDLGNEFAGYTMLLTNIALFISYLIIMTTIDRFGAGKVLPATEILLVIGLIGAVVTTNPIVFLGFYLLWRTMQQLEASAIPLAHYAIVPTAVMGNFSAIRLAMLTLTASISGTAVGFCLAHFAPLTVFAFCAILKLMAGAGYCYGLLAVKKND